MATSLSDYDCSICGERLKSPKLLECLHSFCATPCLMNASVLTGDDFFIVCPLCETETKVPGGDIDSLPTNVFVSRYVDVLSHQQSCLEQGLCGDCEESDSTVTAFCKECFYPICECCQIYHKRHKNTKHHHFVTAEEFQSLSIDSMVNVSDLEACKVHDGEVQKLFCSTCEKMVCQICIVQDHQCHAFQEMKKIYQDFISQIQSVVEDVQSVSKKLENAISSVQRMKESVQQAVDYEVQEVNIAFDEIITVVQARREEIINIIEAKKDEKTKKLNDQLKVLEKEFNNVKESLTFSKQLLKRDGVYEIVSLKKCVQNRLFYLSEKKHSYDPCEHSFLSFKTDQFDDIPAIFKTMGRVISAVFPPRCYARNIGVNSFQVVICDIDGKQVLCGGLKNDISVVITQMVQITKTGGKLIKESLIGDVQEKKDGTYKVSYRLWDDSEAFQIEVFLWGSHIKGSPFKIEGKR